MPNLAPTINWSRSEQVEHLRFVVEELTRVPEDFLPEAHLTTMQGRVAGALFNQPGKIMSVDALMAAACWDRKGDWPQPEVIAVVVCKVRKALPEGWSIETRWGRGYVGLRP